MDVIAEPTVEPVDVIVEPMDVIVEPLKTPKMSLTSWQKKLKNFKNICLTKSYAKE